MLIYILDLDARMGKSEGGDGGGGMIYILWRLFLGGDGWMDGWGYGVLLGSFVGIYAVFGAGGVLLLWVISR